MSHLAQAVPKPPLPGGAQAPLGPGAPTGRGPSELPARPYIRGISC
jgi:hypothetical protein